MIKNKTIKFKVSSGLKQNYSNLGYDFSQNEVYIKIEDLKDVSQVKLDVICDICEGEYNITYAKYVKNIKRNGLYSCKKCGLKKRSNDFKYNNLSLNPEYQEKKKETFIKNYGVDNPSKSQKIKDKKSNTCLKNYGVDNPLKIEYLMREGMIKRHGVEYALQSTKIHEKMVNSLINKYNVNNISKLDYIKDKKIETCLKNYNVENPMQDKNISYKQQKIYKHNYISKYGISHPMQNAIIFKKQLLSMYKITYYNDILFSQGSYELDFLNYCEINGIIDFISNGPSIKYILESDNTNHVYHADFYIEKYNLIIEIKSNYTYNAELDKNLMKEKYCKLLGYNFLFILDKDYSIFNKLLKKENPL